MNRYSIIENKNKREIVLLKSFPCPWGKCSFCDYIDDNSNDEQEMISLNRQILSKVQGIYGKLEVINSASVTCLPKQTLEDIKKVAFEKNIKSLYFEILYIEKNKIDEIREFFKGIDLYFKCGIETFDEEFRNKVLNKRFVIDSYGNTAKLFSNICLMVGIKGQNKEMIDKDIEIGEKYFSNLCINIYTPNTTKIEQDRDIIKYFIEKYSYLDKKENIEILYENTDFGVGE